MDKEIFEETRYDGDAVHIDLWYPRNDDTPNALIVGLMDVRAADDIRIEYDFERDGYRILQQPGIDHDTYLGSTGTWQEVAFVKAWALVEDRDSSNADDLARPAPTRKGEGE